MDTPIVNPGAADEIAPAPLSPDHQILLRHLQEAKFQMGVDDKKWRLLDPILWPEVFISITAPPRPNSPEEWVFRFDLSGYPHQAPTAGLWDTIRHNWLDPALWPIGEGRFSMAFNPGWKNGQVVYIPCDRQSIEGHPNWLVEYPHMIWTPEKDISFYLNILHDYFHSRSYKGVRPA